MFKSKSITITEGVMLWEVNNEVKVKKNRKQKYVWDFTYSSPFRRTLISKEYEVGNLLNVFVMNSRVTLYPYTLN